MNNWKTTITPIVGALASIIGQLGFDITAEQQMAIVTVTLLVMGWFSKDNDVTGGTKAATPEAKERVK